MALYIHKAFTRGFSDLGWLRSGFSFSFAEYSDASRMGFGALRVFNDDTLAPLGGFGMHPHMNMEIVTVLLEGSILHEDDMGHKSILAAPSVQKMSAGTGVFHSEFNASDTEQLRLFQIWIRPYEKGLAPSYAQRTLTEKDFTNTLLCLAEESPKGGALALAQHAKVLRGTWDTEETITYTPQSGNGLFIFVEHGIIVIDGKTIFERDSAEIQDVTSVDIHLYAGSDIVIVEA